MKSTTVLQVQTTEESKLLVKLSKREPKIAKLVGYNVKLTEKSGIQLARIFNRVTAPRFCNWNDSYICKCGGKKCKLTNVVYRAICESCELKTEELEEGGGGIEGIAEKEKKKYVYVGETGAWLKGVENTLKDLEMVKRKTSL